MQTRHHQRPARIAKLRCIPYENRWTPSNSISSGRYLSKEAADVRLNEDLRTNRSRAKYEWCGLACQCDCEGNRQREGGVPVQPCMKLIWQSVKISEGSLGKDLSLKFCPGLNFGRRKGREDLVTVDRSRPSPTGGTRQYQGAVGIQRQTAQCAHAIGLPH